MPSASRTTPASPDFTCPDFTTASSTMAKVHAASVPTAYSAVVMPASHASRRASDALMAEAGAR